MGVYLNPGNEGFRRALRSRIYVDKSELIIHTNRVLASEQGFLCVSRPRRFGKSMAANMLCAYYGKGCDSRELFAGLKIAGDDSYPAHLNRYDVLFLNIQHLLSGAGSADNLVPYLQQTVIAELRGIYGTWISPRENQLASALTAIYGKMSGEERGFVIIVDEWDCVFRESKEKEKAQKQYLDFLKDLFKDRIYVRLAYMTGILPIKKYGTHSALNIFYEYSMTNPRGLGKFVGFTEPEVKHLCETYGMDFEEAKHWYDGYRFHNISHIYNPKSIVDAMLEREFQSYWSGTETYEALKIYLDMNFDGLKDAVVFMLGGGSCRINSRKFQNDMTSFASRDDVFTLLVHLGYLAYDEEEQRVFIPNLEIAEEFETAVEGSSEWTELAGMIRKSDDLLKATWNQDETAVARGLDEIHMENVSVLSYNNENSLSCVISLAYFSARRDYTLVREMPGGKGFADIVFLPRKKSDKLPMIVELKWDSSARGAIRQIKERQYVKALGDDWREILLVGISYEKSRKIHQCQIEKYQKPVSYHKTGRIITPSDPA